MNRGGIISRVLGRADVYRNGAIVGKVRPSERSIR